MWINDPPNWRGLGRTAPLPFLNQRVPKLKDGAKGDPGVSAVGTVLGTIILAEGPVLISLSAGVRRLVVSTPSGWGVDVGQDLLVFPTTAPSAGYATHDVVATAVNTLSVGLSIPLLIIGGSYSITCRLIKLVA